MSAPPPAPRDVPPSKGGVPAGLVWLVCVGGLVGVAVLVAREWGRPPEPGPEPDRFPLTPVSASSYLNTGPDARYVGSEACRACHADRHETFRRTGMGRSMAVVDPAREPPDVTYDHPLSKRRYQVARKNGAVWHREFLLAPGAEPVLLAEHPVTYVVGSGRHSLTYVCEPDGFMTESPVTWYTSKGAWAMSPGYDRPAHRGFEREVGTECLVCHAGRVEAADGTVHRMRVVEPAIGCERCHGPGSVHVEHRRGQPPGPGADGPDRTIVNPRDLPRELAEAVCQQCHLRPTAVVLARGRMFGDFRPGLPLQDFLHTYQATADTAGITVVGHVEQLHLSRCYQKSDTLTCVTCHDPHGEPRPEARVEYYRAACRQCHEPAACKVSPERRAKESPANDCVQCHMPRSPTDIPHLAFSHHRIGVHDKPRASRGGGAGGPDGLEPLLDLSRFAEIDRQRSLGLAYREAGNAEKDRGRSERHHARAFELLSAVRAAGLRDAPVETGLARIVFDRTVNDVGAPEARPYAEAALADPAVGPQDRCMALYFLASALAAEGRHGDALGPARDLTRLRRHSADWLLIADCERAVGREEAWADALATAVRINPRLWREQKELGEYYARRGDGAKASHHRARAVP